MEIVKLTQKYSWENGEIILMDSEDRQYFVVDVESFERELKDFRFFPDVLRDNLNKLGGDFDMLAEECTDHLISTVNKWFEDEPYQWVEHFKRLP
jgi:hypothetical protein